jgi:deoxyribodipyrimidine photo-lyase
VVPVYIWSPEEEGDWAPGAASRWWLHHSLERLAESLRAAGSRLIVRRGEAAAVLRELAEEVSAGALHFNRRYEPAAAARDEQVREQFRKDGREAYSFNSGLLFEPWIAQKADGTPYQVFTAFWNACLKLDPPPRPAPKRIPGRSRWPASEAIEDLELLPSIDWAETMRETWTPGEEGALAAWRRFLRSAAADYDTGRDVPGVTGTSRMSPHLHLGEISPRRLWHNLSRRLAKRPPAKVKASLETYRRELGWREFAYHLLHFFPRTPEEPLRLPFNRFPWRKDAAGLRAWQRGRTGYPIVDAGMRELWATGWMHNRVRMIVASFLVKHLLLPWQEGARWFWDTLVDADLANNTLGWQWTAGCGADAAPYFRIFNPVLQGKKYDPEGAYVRRWVPELAELPDRWLHAPWEASAAVLSEAGVALGRSYPKPMVDHKTARKRALKALEKTRR